MHHSDSVHHTPFCWGGGGGRLNLLPIFKKGEAWQDLNFESRVARKEKSDLFQGWGCNF